MAIYGIAGGRSHARRQRIDGGTRRGAAPVAVQRVGKQPGDSAGGQLSGSHRQTGNEGSLDEFICATYLERDVRSVTNIRDLATFRFLSLVASRHGQIVNRTDLAAMMGVSVPTIGGWLDILEITGQIILVPPYFENFRQAPHQVAQTISLRFRTRCSASQQQEADVGMVCY